MAEDPRRVGSRPACPLRRLGGIGLRGWGDRLAHRPRRGGPLYHLPIHAFLTPDHTAISPGCARRALEEAARGAVGNLRVSTAVALGDRPAFRRDLGRAHTRLESARLQVRQVIEKVWVVAAAGDAVGPDLILDCRSPTRCTSCGARPFWREWPTRH